VELDRKILADLAINEPKAFTKIVLQAKEGLAKAA
jgi:ribosomal protein L20